MLLLVSSDKRLLWLQCLSKVIEINSELHLQKSLKKFHNFVVIAPMIMKFRTGVMLDEFYTMVAKNL